MLPSIMKRQWRLCTANIWHLFPRCSLVNISILPHNDIKYMNFTGLNPVGSHSDIVYLKIILTRYTLIVFLLTVFGGDIKLISTLIHLRARMAQ